MIFRIYLGLALMVLLSIYVVVSQILHAEEEVAEVKDRIKAEVKIQTHRYLEARATKTFGDKRKKVELKLSPKEEKIAANLDSHFDPRNLPPVPDDIETIALPPKPYLDPDQPQYDPNEKRPYNQSELDRIVRRLQVIQEVPDDYYKKIMLDDFRKDMNQRLEQQHNKQLSHWILEEIDNIDDGIMVQDEP